MSLLVTHDMETCQQALASLTEQGKTLALVPTMGALHAGHISLVRQAKEQADAVLVTIFVNPTQFSEGEDFTRYPRDLEADLDVLREAGADVVYAPSAEDMYPGGFTTRVSVGALGEILCGAHRPGHFDGVATVVTKLLLRFLPHVALFGEKDYQQLCVIGRLAYDLDVPVAIAGCATVREADGLALSSRNRYLSKEERAIAPKLHAALKALSQAIIGGADLAATLSGGIDTLTRYGFRVDYLELRENDTLDPVTHYEGDARLLVAATLGTTRLIDNIALEPAGEDDE